MRTITELPNNMDAEQRVISCLLMNVNNQTYREILDTVSPDDFYSMQHSKIFAAIRDLNEKGRQTDAITVDDYLGENGESDFCGGFVYLAQVQKSFISYAGAKGAVDILKKAKASRDLISIATSIDEMSNLNQDPRHIISSVEHQLRNISIDDSGRDLQHIKEAGGDWFDRLEERAELGGQIAGLSTGFDQIDERLNGIGKECLVVVAGRPSMGKTLFTQSLAQNVGVTQGKNVLFFSMEMSKVELYERFISGLSNVPADSLKKACFENDELGRIQRAVNELDRSGITFTEEPAQSLAQIRSKSRKHKNKHGDIGMIIIDYLGLMELERAERHDISIGKVTRGLKQLAKELQTPIFLIAQANRDLDKAKRPTMSNLKDSSSIEADADIVMFVHRQEVVEPETELKGLTEIIIAKDRHNDGNGTVFMEKLNGKFSELTYEQAGSMMALEERRKNPPREKMKKGF